MPVKSINHRTFAALAGAACSVLAAPAGAQIQPDWSVFLPAGASLSAGPSVSTPRRTPT